jgi:hypothetical protein
MIYQEFQEMDDSLLLRRGELSKSGKLVVTATGHLKARVTHEYAP